MDKKVPKYIVEAINKWKKGYEQYKKYEELVFEWGGV